MLNFTPQNANAIQDPSQRPPNEFLQKDDSTLALQCSTSCKTAIKAPQTTNDQPTNNHQLLVPSVARPAPYESTINELATGLKKDPSETPFPSPRRRAASAFATASKPALH
ncbi:hypothetical protein VTL71DRAFT_13893, partial [Oculimacula yallundae]